MGVRPFFCLFGWFGGFLCLIFCLVFFVSLFVIFYYTRETLCICFQMHVWAHVCYMHLVSTGTFHEINGIKALLLLKWIFCHYTTKLLDVWPHLAWISVLSVD